MKKILTTILLILIIFGGLVPSVANAAWWEFLSPSTWAPAAIYALGGIVVTLTAGVLWISNEIFNFSIYLSIYGFNDFLDGTGVNEAWEIMRDFTNIFFIFILLYIAVGTMFQLFSAKQLLVRVIIVALLINFSAILPKVIIDTSNILAIEFYERIGDGKTPTGAPDVTKAIVSRLGLFSEPEGKEVDLLEEYKSASKDSNSKKPTSSVTGAIVSVFGKIVFLLVTAFVLAIGAWMFVLRTVVLLLLIIFSPIAVLAAALPKTYSFFDKWLKRLINEAFFAPAYLFMLYITITIVKGTDFGKLVKVDDSQSAVYAPVVVAFNFFVIIFLMSASLIIAKMMGAQGAAQIGKAKSFGLGLVGGATGLAGAYSVGKFAKKAADSDLVKKWASNKPILGGGLARDTLNKLAGQKFGSSASYNERTEKVAKRIEGFKTPELQANYLASLRPVDREEAFKKLSDRQKSILNAGVEKLPDTDRRKQAVEGLIGDLSYEEREKMDKSRADAEKQKGEAIARINTERAMQLLTEGKRRKIEGYEKDLAGEEDKSRPIYAKHKDKGYENQYVYEDADGKDLPAIKSGEQPISESDLMGRLKTEQISKIIKDVPIGSAGKLKKILDVRDKDNNIVESKNNVAKTVIQSMNKSQLLKLFEKDADLKDDQIEVINKALNDRDARIPQEIKENIERLQKAVASHPKAKSLGIEIPTQNNPGSPNPNRVILTDSRGNPIT